MYSVVSILPVKELMSLSKARNFSTRLVRFKNSKDSFKDSILPHLTVSKEINLQERLPLCHPLFDIDMQQNRVKLCQF